MRSKPTNWPAVRARSLGQHGHVCWWCGRKLVNVSDIRKNKRIKVLKHNVIWRGDGKVKIGWLATVDHIRPRCRGGINDQYNLVPSCHECNQMRAKFMDKAWKPLKPGVRKQFIKHNWTKRVESYQTFKKVFLSEKTRGGGRADEKTTL